MVRGTKTGVTPSVFNYVLYKFEEEDEALDADLNKIRPFKINTAGWSNSAGKKTVLFVHFSFLGGGVLLLRGKCHKQNTGIVTPCCCTAVISLC